MIQKTKKEEEKECQWKVLTPPGRVEDDAQGEELDGAHQHLGQDLSWRHLAPVHTAERKGHGCAHDEDEPAHREKLVRHGNYLARMLATGKMLIDDCSHTNCLAPCTSNYV